MKMKKVLSFVKDLVTSPEFFKGLLIGSAVMAVAFGVHWLVN
jgi:hypothetical protein